MPRKKRSTGIPYHTPPTSIAGVAPHEGGIARGIVMKGGVAHEVVLIRIQGAESLVSGATLYGWVANKEFIQSE